MNTALCISLRVLQAAVLFNIYHIKPIGLIPFDFVWQLLNILEGDFLTEQMESISFLSRQIAVLQRVKESPVGEFLFDQELYKEKR